MARFNETWMETLLSKNDIVSLVSSYVALRPKGKKLWGLCPFHNEKTPSFSVSPDKQLYYCFGCGAGGGIVQFAMEMEKLPYAEAIAFLAQRVNMELPQETDDEALRQERAKRERLYAAAKVAAEFFHKALLSEEGAFARAYLANRGLDAAIVTRFGIGYAPDSWDRLMKHLLAEGFLEDELVEAGLLVKNAKSGRVYDAYRNRVTFPIIGTNGRVLGFGARTMGNDTPKYINTGDTPIYSKRHNLYALNLLKGAKISDIVLVEGYMDVISLYASGVTNAVASLGTSLTQQQARLMARYAPTVYIAYDGDAAGQNATLRGLDILVTEGLKVRVITLPDGIDPDDFARKYGKEAFDKLRDTALTLNAFKLMRMAAAYDLGTEDGREEYARAGCRFIAGLEPVERERYYVALARSTGFTVEALRAQGEQATPEKQQETQRFRKENRGRRQGETSPRQVAELSLLRAMLQGDTAVEKVRDCGLTLEHAFTNEVYRMAAEALLSAHLNAAKPDLALLLSGLSPEETQQLSGVLDTEAVSADPGKLADDSIFRIRLLDTEEEISQLRARSIGGEIPLAEKLALAKRIAELDNMRRQLRMQQ